MNRTVNLADDDPVIMAVTHKDITRCMKCEGRVSTCWDAVSRPREEVLCGAWADVHSVRNARHKATQAREAAVRLIFSRCFFFSTERAQKGKASLGRAVSEQFFCFFFWHDAPVPQQ